MAQIRQPAVAGHFYPLRPQELTRLIESFAKGKESASQKETAIGCLLPHAGYMYSGSVAYSTASQIKIGDILIILGPNHTGMGEAFSVMDNGYWVTPLGSRNINAEVAKKLQDTISFLKADFKAHEFEHSIEVQLPMLQYIKKDFTFVPIIIGGGDFKAYQTLGQAIASAIKELGIENKSLIIASSDMSHYEDELTAKAKDKKAIEAIIELDEAKLWSRITEFNISMCGYAPAIAMLAAAKALGAKNGKLVSYQTSGDVTGDKSSVVGYAGIIVN